MKGKILRGLIKTILVTVLASFVCFEILGDVDLQLVTLEGYLVLFLLLIIVIGLLTIYCVHYGQDLQMLSFLVMLIVSGIVVFSVGYAFQITLNNIIVAWFISLPSVLLLDRLFK